MGQRHQVSRRRSFGRRQHELRERLEHGRRWEPEEPNEPAQTAQDRARHDRFSLMGTGAHSVQLGISG